MTRLIGSTRSTRTRSTRTRSIRPRLAGSARSLAVQRVKLASVAALLAIAVLAALALAGCAAKAAAPTVAPGSTAATVFPVTITDDASRTVTVKAEPQRIVSLAPAGTEILFALGQGKKVVGVTSYDDYPSQVASIAKVGDFAGPNVEAVAAAKPDLILATTGVQADVVTKLEALGATVVVLDPQSLMGVYNDIAKVGSISGASIKTTAALVDSMRGEVSSIQKLVAAGPTVTAFIEIGQNPLFTTGTGTLMDELVDLAGGKNVVTQPGYVSRYRFRK